MKPVALPPLALGIDLGGTKIHAELLGSDGASLWQQRHPTPAGRYDETLGALAHLVQHARQLAGTRGLTVGIGGPGALDVDGTVKNANSTCLNGRRLVDDLQARVGQPVRYANDANCLTLSESVDGAGAGFGVVFAVILGTGVGSGIAVHSRVHEGPNRLAGEWGHNPLPWMNEGERAIAQAEPCWCGQQGCIEAFVSGPALARDHQRHTGEALSAEDIAHRAAAGDAACAASLQRHTGRLGRALASVINLLDPDVIVLAGGLSLMPHLVPALPQAWAPPVFSSHAGDTVRTALRIARHGDASGVRGAAWLWQP
ncbi:MAG: ROK family protein [Rubrivivax sp.]